MLSLFDDLIEARNTPEGSILEMSDHVCLHKRHRRQLVRHEGLVPINGEGFQPPPLVILF